MELPVGLYSRINAQHEYSVVLHPEFSSHCSLFVWYGRHDIIENFAQGHCSLQSGILK